MSADVNGVGELHEVQFNPQLWSPASQTLVLGLKIQCTHSWCYRRTNSMMDTLAMTFEAAFQCAQGAGGMTLTIQI